MTTNRSVLLEPEGQVTFGEQPFPEPGPRQALVRVLAGAVSTGTETTMIRQRRTVAATRTTEAELPPTIRLGYSAAGRVEAVGPDYDGPPVGTPVAIYGAPYAGHAQWCVVGQNLIALAEGLPAEEAAFGGIGAIALHAVRLAGVELGQRVGVMGLGVIGQVAAQLARAAGAWVIASDPLEIRREAASSAGLDRITTPQEWADTVAAFTRGQGLDTVLVCAGTPDDAGPAVAGLQAVRYRGRVVIVGNVRTEWPRELLFHKEASVVVSRAAGPGRYDHQYEAVGQDMPPALVPWTEGRNLRCFVELLAAGRVQVAPLISGILEAEQAADAYERLIERPNDTLALVLRFDGSA